MCLAVQLEGHGFDDFASKRGAVDVALVRRPARELDHDRQRPDFLENLATVNVVTAERK